MRTGQSRRTVRPGAFEGEDEAEGAGFFAGFGDGEVGEVGDFDLVAVDGETHGDEGGDESYCEHR